MVDKTNYKYHLRFFMACLICILSSIGVLGCLNYSVAAGGLYIVAGISMIGTIVYFIAHEYKKFNNDTE